MKRDWCHLPYRWEINVHSCPATPQHTPPPSDERETERERETILPNETEGTWVGGAERSSFEADFYRQSQVKTAEKFLDTVL